MSSIFQQPDNTQHNDLINNEVNGQCSKCGNCCNAAPMPMTQSECNSIADYIVKHNIKPLNREWVNSIQNGENVGIDLRCCFYDSVNKRCAIYDVRPAICKRFKCSNSTAAMNYIKDDTHAAAHYNHMTSKSADVSNVTNMDLLFYADIMPLQIYCMHFMQLSAKQFAQFYESFCSTDTYELKI